MYSFIRLPIECDPLRRPLLLMIRSDQSKRIDCFQICDNDHHTLLDLLEYLQVRARVTLLYGASDQYQYEPWTRAVHIPRSMGSPREIFAVFHEAGHAITYDKDPDLQGDQAVYKMFGSRSAGVRTDPFITSERRAWREAIVLGRDIRAKSGIDLFKIFGSIDQFVGWVRVFLRSHEYDSWRRELPAPLTKDLQLAAFLTGQRFLSSVERASVRFLLNRERREGMRLMPHGFSTSN